MFRRSNDDSQLRPIVIQDKPQRIRAAPKKRRRAAPRRNKKPVVSGSPLIQGGASMYAQDAHEREQIERYMDHEALRKMQLQKMIDSSLNKPRKRRSTQRKAPARSDTQQVYPNQQPRPPPPPFGPRPPPPFPGMPPTQLPQQQVNSPQKDQSSTAAVILFAIAMTILIAGCVLIVVYKDKLRDLFNNL